MIQKLTAIDLGISLVDLKAVATTQYKSRTLNLEAATAFDVFVTIDNTGGGAAGDAKLSYARINPDGTERTAVDLVTAIDTKADVTSLLSFGRGLAAALTGASSGTAAADLDQFRAFGQIKLILEVTTANNGTTSVGSVEALVME